MAYWVILDLDETLFSSSRRKKCSQCLYIEWKGILDGGKEKEARWICKRPSCDSFLHMCFDQFHVGVWSVGQPNYVNEIVRTIFPKEPEIIYNWTHVHRHNYQILKPLRQMFPQIESGDGEGKNFHCILIDNEPGRVAPEDQGRTIIVPDCLHMKVDGVGDNILQQIMLWFPQYKGPLPYTLPRF